MLRNYGSLRRSQTRRPLLSPAHEAFAEHDLDRLYKTAASFDALGVIVSGRRGRCRGICLRLS
jgi:hypothetical protein